jgi:hypothetical protein
VNNQSWNWVEKYQQYLNDGCDRDAFTAFVRGMNMSPLSNLPHWLANVILKLAIRGANWEAKRRHLRTNLREHIEVKKLAGNFKCYSAIKIPLLVIGGEKSSHSVKEVLRNLSEVVIKSNCVLMPGLEHFAPENGYAPLPVARMLRDYFGS